MKSPFGYALWKAQYPNAKYLLSLGVDNPVFQILMVDGLSPQELMGRVHSGLKMIQESPKFKLETEIKKSLIYVRDHIKISSTCEQTMSYLISSSTIYNIDVTNIIKEVFGQQYFQNEPLAWQYPYRKTKTTCFTCDICIL